MQHELDTASAKSDRADLLDQFILRNKLKRQGRHAPSLKQIAAESGFSYSYVRRRHAAFLRDKGYK